MGKLHDRMKEDLLLKAYSPHTQSAYLRCARHFASHYMRSPEEMGEQEIRGFLLHLVRDRKKFFSGSSQGESFLAQKSNLLIRVSQQKLQRVLRQKSLQPQQGYMESKLGK